MRATQFLKEYQDPAEAKREIIDKVGSLDPSDEEQAKLIDRVYSIVNKTGVVDRFLPVVNSKLAGEYGDKARQDIAERIVSSDRLNIQQKNKFLDNLQANKCVNPNTLLKDGHYSISEIFNNDPVNEQMFLEFLDFGAGLQRAGKGEHALAIMSQNITQKGLGDIDVNGVAVELKVGSSTKVGGGSGRLGEGGVNRDRVLGVLASYPKLDSAVQGYFAQGKKTMNLKLFVELVNSVKEIEQNERRALGNSVFSLMFQNFADPITAEFSKPNADPERVWDAYVAQNFEWYKANPDMGGNWEVICSMGIGSASMVTCSNGKALVNMVRNGQLNMNTPNVVVSQGPEVFFQVNPRRK